MLNTISLQGNLTRDPELRFTPAGKAVLSFGLAWNQKRGDTDKVIFFDVAMFGDTAETLSKLITKGQQVIVEGQMDEDQWNDKDTGKKRTHKKIIANRLHFCGPKRDRATPPQRERPTTADIPAREAAPASDTTPAVNEDDVPF